MYARHAYGPCSRAGGAGGHSLLRASAATKTPSACRSLMKTSPANRGGVFVSRSVPFELARHHVPQLALHVQPEVGSVAGRQSLYFGTRTRRQLRMSQFLIAQQVFASGEFHCRDCTNCKAGMV